MSEPEKELEYIDYTNPFRSPRIDNYCSEKEPTNYLTREDIRELGFFRSNPNKRVYTHKDNSELFLQEYYERDYSVKDIVVRRVIVFYENSNPRSLTLNKVIYNSTDPKKEEIKKLI